MTPDRTTDCSKRTFDGMVRLMSHTAAGCQCVHEICNVPEMP